MQLRKFLINYKGGKASFWTQAVGPKVIELFTKRATGLLGMPEKIEEVVLLNSQVVPMPKPYSDAKNVTELLCREGAECVAWNAKGEEVKGEWVNDEEFTGRGKDGWRDAKKYPPTTTRNVMCQYPPPKDPSDEEVWPGYYDAGRWHTGDGLQLSHDEEPLFWQEFPAARKA